MAEKLVLGGREYVRAGVGPARQDLYVMQHARAAGLSGIREGEAPEEYMARLLDSCLSSGRALLLLGGLLVPAGSKAEDWTEEQALATAEHLGGILEPAEKSKLYAEVASALLAFFDNGIGSWVASGRSSASAAGPQQNSTSGTGSGEESSEPSPATTTMRRRRSWLGRWRRSSSPSGTTAAAGSWRPTGTSR